MWVLAGEGLNELVAEKAMAAGGGFGFEFFPDGVGEIGDHLEDGASIVARAS